MWQLFLKYVPAEVSEKHIHLIPSLFSLHSLSYHVIIENTVYSWTHWYSWVGYEDATKQPNMALFVHNKSSPAASWGIKGVRFIPERLVTELAGVRQTSTSFLLATGGHAEVTAAIGHLWGRRHIFTGGRGRHPGQPCWVIITIWQIMKQTQEIKTNNNCLQQENTNTYFLHCCRIYKKKKTGEHRQKKLGVKQGALEWLRRSYIFLGRQKAGEAACGSSNEKKKIYTRK